jgi:hypothetical protein
VKPRNIVIGVLVVVGALVVPGLYLYNQLDQPTSVEGVVVGVKTRPPLAVDSFELLVPDGRRLTFTVGKLDMSPGGFDAPHLVSHQATGQPVIVLYRTNDDELVAVRLMDGAFPAAPSATPPRATGSPTASASQ